MWNPFSKLQNALASAGGQTFMNYAYNWGAAVVILGTLFKLTHIEGANTMLFVGMGTEVFVFFISAFDKTYTDIPDEETPAGNGQTILVSGGSPLPEGAEMPQGPIVIGGGAPVVGGMPIIGGAEAPSDGVSPVFVGGPSVSMDGGASDVNYNPEAMAAGAGLSAAAANLAAAGQAAAEAQLALSQLNNGGVDARTIRATDPADVETAVANYAEELRELTEVLSRVKEQTAKMSTDSDEMENLNRTLTGIATVYELQLRNISKQVTTIEQIDEQTRKMATQIEELNNVYARMIKALTVNMGGATPAIPTV